MTRQYLRKSHKHTHRSTTLHCRSLEDRLAPAALMHSLMPAGVPGDRFGWSAATSATYRVVAQPYWDGAGGANTGNAFVYDAATNLPLFNLENPSGQVDSLFGSAVSISEQHVVIAASGFDTATATSVGIAYVFDLHAKSPTTPAVTLVNPQPNAGDQFGFSVAIAGQYVVVGTLYDDTFGTDAGTAYVYNLASATPGLPLATLTSPVPGAGDLFGYSVAASGTSIVIGEVYSDFGAAKSGSAYVFDLGSPAPTTPIATLRNPTPFAGDQFGVAVAASGQLVVVGANQDDTGAANSGMAYVYDLAGKTPSMPTLTLNNPTPATDDYFGRSVGVSGQSVVVGTYADDVGAAAAAGVVHVYDLTSKTPTIPALTLNNPQPVASDLFGHPLAISGTSILIGNALHESGAADSGVAYVYDLKSSTPALPVVQLKNHIPARDDSFGRSLALSSQHLVVGAYGNQLANTDHPSVYVYELNGTAPTSPVMTLKNPTPAAGDNFGSAVAVAGKYIVVGDPFDDTGALNAGRAYVYEIGSANPATPIAILSNPAPLVDDYFGHAVAVSGQYVVVGAYLDNFGATDSGAAYVYDLTSKTPTVPIVTLNNPLPGASDWFGWTVAISGTRIIVGSVSDDIGATNAGAAFVYDIDSPTPTLPIATLTSPTPAANDYFGYSVAISSSTAVVGAYLDDTGANNAGSAYVFELNQSPPTVITLNNPAPGSDDNFGATVAVSGNTVVVGNHHTASKAANAGQAYVFDLGAATPTLPIETLNYPLPGAADHFAQVVAVSGQTVVAGVPRDDTLSDDGGAVYVFDMATTAKIAEVAINGGASQRSRLTSLAVTFDQVITFTGSPVAAFQLKRQGDNAVVTLSAVANNTSFGTVVTLTFTGGAVDSGSLADGRYTLTVLAAQVTNLDGDGNGTIGGDFVLVGTPANGLFRLFGDADGDSDVDTTDFGAFRAVFGGMSSTFDFDNDGDVDTGDFGAFRARFGGSV